MSESQEYKLAQSLIWSTTDFSLAEFVDQYELPQVVFVEVGYDGGDERNTFSSGQILTLHSVRTVSKIVCHVPPNNAVLVPKKCPLKAEVISMDCHETVVTAYKLSTIYRKVKYVRVMELGSAWDNDSLVTTRIDDILQIKKVSTAESVIRCRNLTSEQDMSIPIGSTAVFVPLADSNTHTLAEIQKKFGLPAKIRFLDKNAERKLRLVSKERHSWKTSAYLSDMGQIKAIEEMEDKDVIVTTVCSNLDEKVCLPVPTTLDIRLTVAEGFLKGDETYQKVVKTLDKQLKRTDLDEIADLDVQQHRDAVKKELENMSTVSTVEDAPKEIQERARQNAQRISAKQQKKKFLSFNRHDKPPKLVPRGQASAVNRKPPPRPPKSGQEPEPKHKTTGKIFNEIKSKSSKLLSSLERKQSHNHSTSSDDVYEEAIEQDDGIYSYPDEAFRERSESEDSNSSSEYQELDANYKSVQRYGKLLPKPSLEQKKSHPSSIQSLPLPPTPTPTPTQTTTPPPLPTTSPPQTQEDRNAIYEAISRYPQDLSGLSVADVSRLLRYLGLKDYVEKFENELIDGTMLTTLDRESLQSLNVQQFHCNKLLRFIGGWRPNV